MKTKTKNTAYIVHSIAAAVLLLTAQISLAGSATWLLSPQDSAWENANNWTPGGPPNGPSDIATFAHSSQTVCGHLDLGGGEQHRIQFRLRLFRFLRSHLGSAQLIISGTGVINNNSVSQTFAASNEGQIVFNNASSAASAHMSIVNGANLYRIPPAIQSSTTHRVRPALRLQRWLQSAEAGPSGQTIFNGASTADHASIRNDGPPASHGGRRPDNFQ